MTAPVIAKRSLTAAIIILLGAASALVTIPTDASAQTPSTEYQVEVGKRLRAFRADGSRIPSTSIRFMPDELDVHSGDVIHFFGEIFLTPVVLLPPPYTPTTTPTDPHAWLAKRNNYAYDLDDPWYFVAFDPDDDRPGDEETPHTKVNNRVVLPPLRCGQTADRACPFPMPGLTDPVNGVLGSGQVERDPSTGELKQYPTELYVRIQAEPGTTIWATMLSAVGMNMRINVVPDDQPATSLEASEEMRKAELARATQRVVELDEQYADYRVKEKLPDGTTRWEALGGIEMDGVTILQAYPRDIRIKKGDSVLWRSDLLPGQYHTVTFPTPPKVIQAEWPNNLTDYVNGIPGQGKPLYRIVCDMDTDAGSAPDMPQLLRSPVFCPGFSAQFEIELLNYVVYEDGDGRYEGPDDWETSGIIGAAPHPAPGFRPYELTFPVESPKEGFTYACLLHPVMAAEGGDRPSGPRKLGLGGLA